jgi:precorrin-3B C17-methyltransferase
MTPWGTIRARLEAAAMADFVVALFNPRSARRRTPLAEAAAILLQHRRSDTPVFIGRNLGRVDETRQIVALSELADAVVDMSSLVIIGSRETRRVAAGAPHLYTPRGYFDPPTKNRRARKQGNLRPQ